MTHDATNSGANPFHGLDEKAKAAKSGNQDSIGALLDDIVIRYGLLGASDDAKEVVKERVVRSEMRFRKGEARGIPEKKLVQMINELAAVIGAPLYAQTNLRHVRHIRFARLVYLPNLITQQAVSKTDPQQNQMGSSISSYMSPIEAVYLAMDLIYQKMSTDAFQVTPKEFSANLDKYRLEAGRVHKIEEDQGSTQRTAGPNDETAFQLAPTDTSSKNTEMNEISRLLSQLNRTDALTLLRASLDTLGIDQ